MVVNIFMCFLPFVVLGVSSWSLLNPNICLSLPPRPAIWTLACSMIDPTPSQGIFCVTPVKSVSTE